MSKTYERLEDPYEDIKGACRDTLEDNKNILKMPIERAIAFYFHEYGGMLEDNEVENVVILISLGLFIIENSYHDEKYIEKVKYAINEIKSNEYNKFLFDKNDRKLIDKDIKIIENSELLE